MDNVKNVMMQCGAGRFVDLGKPRGHQVERQNGQESTQGGRHEQQQEVHGYLCYDVCGRKVRLKLNFSIFYRFSGPLEFLRYGRQSALF